MWVYYAITLFVSAWYFQATCIYRLLLLQEPLAVIEQYPQILYFVYFIGEVFSPISFG